MYSIAAPRLLAVVILRDLAQQHAAAVVQLDGQHFAFVVGGFDLRRGRHEVGMDRADG